MPKDKKRDPMPPPDATPEEIGEFWDTHDFADYWDETEEVEFQVNLKSEQNQVQSDEVQLDLPSTIADETRPALGIVTDLVSESVLPAPIRRNALKAFDRLCSALIDVPVGALERRAAEKRAESEARIKIRDEITTQITQQIKVDPEYALRAGHKYAEKIIREQLNLDKISAIAANELKNSESSNPTNPDTSEPNEKLSADSSNQEANSGEKKVIDDDWLNSFETAARQKSTEDIQLRFARVLAGEIEKPGSYSIRTVKILCELDQDVAVLFKKLCSMCVAFERRVDDSILDVRVLSLDRSLRKGNYGKYHLNHYQLDVLIEYGLIDFMENVYLSPYNLCIESPSNLIPQPFQHQGRDWIFSPLDPIQEFRLNGFSCTRAGRELFRIVDQDPMPEYTEDIKEYFTGQNLQMVEVPIQ